jgi:iron complex outermembrane receptor protein
MAGVSRGRGRGRVLGVAATLAAATPLAAAAQEATPAVARDTTPERAPAPGACVPEPALVPAAPRRWPAPLDRAVALDARGLPLAEALDRLQAAARVRLTYSPEALPRARVACVARARATVGDLLAELLRGAPLAPVVAGDDHVVLAPAQPAVVGDSAPAFAARPGVLERVVVTGSAMGAALGAPERALPVALSVARGADVAARAGGAATLAQALDGGVPGVWAWAQAPTSLVTAWASVRGASSFGVTGPKIYVDGIELANPLLLTRLDPASVERVEMIRGPQGAALYGADAISGVVNVLTRHDGAAEGAGDVSLRLTSRAGTSRSDFTRSGAAPGTPPLLAAGGVLAQEHALAVRAGRGTRTAALGVTLGTLGAYLPGASSRTLLVTGSGRVVGRRSIVTGTLRVADDAVGAVVNPLLAGAAPPPDTAHGTLPDGRGTWRDLVAGGATGRQALRQYTLGTSATLAPAGRWTHALVAGLDGYRLDGAAVSALPVLSPADSALRAAEGATDRLTLRASSVARFGDTSGAGGARGASGSVTLAVEQSTARDATRGAPRVAWRSPTREFDGPPVLARLTGPLAHGGPAAPVPPVRQEEWWSTTGLVAQGTAGWRDLAFATAGLRLERNGGSLGAAQYAALPMLGASLVRDVARPFGAGGDALTVKLRAAYGRGIRPARTLARSVSWLGRVATAPAPYAGATLALAPEAQAGVEAGADLLLGRRLALHVTRFDQRATNLIQPVAVSLDGMAGSPAPGPAARRLGYVLQNVGAIANRGWELEARWRHESAAAGELSLAGTLTTTSSEVARLAAGYRGDLRTGDRMLGVPARTLGATATWARGRWSTGWSAARASDWVQYDRLALAAALTSDAYAPRAFVGPALRAYWRRYDGVTRLRGQLGYRVARTLSLDVSADNLLDRQLGEPDNATIVPGRTVTVGVRVGN